MILLLALGCVGPGKDDEVTTPPPGAPEDPSLDDAHRLLVTEMGALHAYGADGGRELSWDVAAASGNPTCEGGQCRAEGVTVDGGSLVFSWALQNGQSTYGGLVWLDPVDGGWAPAAAVEGWRYPHEVQRDPTAERYLVADALADGIYWVPADRAAEPEDAVYVLSGDTVDTAGAHIPNGMWLLPLDGHVYLLVSYRGDDARNPGSEIGRLILWDVVDPAAPRRVWVYPATGNLQAPHDPSLHGRDGRWYVVYAHSHGDGGDRGTVGVAVTDDLEVQPGYLADLRDPGDRWAFPRGAIWTGDGELIVTDTGGAGPTGAVYRMPFPALPEASGRSGAYRADGAAQDFVELDGIEVFAEGFEETYRAVLWGR